MTLSVWSSCAILRDGGLVWVKEWKGEPVGFEWVVLVPLSVVER